MRAINAFALTALLTAAPFANGPASAAPPATTSVRCALPAHLTAPLAQAGAVVGTLKCGRSLGKGSYDGRYRDNVAHWPTASETGSSKLLDLTCTHRIPPLTRCTLSGSVSGVS